jgi:hypothetical protein
MQASQDRMGGWTRTRAGLLRGWMAASAVVWGISTSPVFAQMMQPAGMMVVQEESGQETPGMASSPCDVLNGERATPEMLAALQLATTKDTVDGIRESIPRQLQDEFDASMGAPLRFYNALYPQIPSPPGVRPMYMMTDEPVAGKTHWALVSNGFTCDVTLESVEAIDLAGAVASVANPALVIRHGEAGWSVTGTAKSAQGEGSFTGMILSMPSQGVMTYWLVVEKDFICPEFAPLLSSSMGESPSIAGEAMPNAIAPGEEGPLGFNSTLEEPSGWPRLPDLSGPCWDAACVAGKVREYSNTARGLYTLMRAGVDGARSIYATESAILHTALIAQRALLALYILTELRNCLIFSWFPWIVAGCMVAILAYEAAAFIAMQLAFNVALDLLRSVRDAAIKIAICLFLKAVASAYNAAIDGIVRACWHCPELQPPAIPRLPVPTC